MQEQEITLNFSLTLKEANTVLASLSKMPYETVVDIITKIQNQAIPQLKPEQKSTEIIEE